jgi:hypothetical protein
MTETLTKIELNENEAKCFIQFQKHFSLIQALNSIRAFDIRNGSVTINFDSLGRIGSIDKWEQFRP